MVIRAVTIGLACCLVLAACGSDDPYNSEAVSLTYDQSPINELLGIDIALRSGDLVELEREAERKIVECMTRSGFEYIAIDFAAQFATADGADDPDTRAYVEANGYGISIRPAFDEPALDELVDPNDAIVEQLSDAELEAYELALFGEAPVDDQPVAPEDRSGCVAEAYDKVYAAQAELGTVENFFGEFGPELSELEERFLSDPRFLEIEAAWATCMSEAGFDVASRNEIFIERDRRMSDVAVDLDPEQEPTPALEARMEAVREWERNVAVAEWDCNAPNEDELRSLRYGYEALFLEVNSDRLPNDG